jgi:environmental stress-induced protein Ves
MSEMRFCSRITPVNHHKTSQWAGGTTTELCIYPEGAVYANRDFDFRISSAVVDMESSIFTLLPGYERHLMVLSGKTRLEHKNHHSITLSPFEQDIFMGDWETESFGKCIDFNLMLNDKYTGSINSVKSGFALDCLFSRDSFGGFYILTDDVTLTETRMDKGDIPPKVSFHTLNKGDFVFYQIEGTCIDHIINPELKLSLTGPGGYLAVQTLIERKQESEG